MQRLKNVPFDLIETTRRSFLKTTSALSVSTLAACGAAKGLDPDPDIEGVDFFTVNTRVLNFSANFGAITIAAAGTTLVNNLPYGAISPVATVVLDAPFFRDSGQTFPTTSITTTSPAGSYSLTNLSINQALYLVTSSVTNSVTSVAATKIGGVAGPYPSANLGTTPFSKLYLITSALSSVNAFTQATPTSAVQTAGLLTNSTSGINIPAAASTNFRLTLKDAQSSALVYDSGLKAKDEATAIFVARDAALSATWTVFAIDKNFVVSRWTNTI
jgi:hypothetical protein